jgi:hypothetical protein
MPRKSYVTRNALNAGEISELVSFRDDVDKYKSACKILENSIPLVEGGAKKMPGSYFAGPSALGGAMFTASIAGTAMTVTAVNYGTLRVGQTVYGDGVTAGTTIATMGLGTQGGAGPYTVNNSQTVPSERMMTAASGKSRLVPFQFSTAQGAILEFSAGVVRVWQAATQGYWFLGITTAAPNEPNYDPSHLYAANDIALIGPTSFISSYGGTPAGSLAISFPYGATNSSSVWVTFSVNTSDVLSVTATGTIPSQGINIALANATHANNSAANIQAAIRALVSLNTTLSNFVDLSEWTVTPDTTYYATPWIIAPVSEP